MKPIIICIVGASGSGKTHMSKFLYEGFGIPMVVSMTTRPKRRNEIDGIDHKFVSKETINKEKKSDNILAYTQFGDYEYCALHSDIKDKPICSYVIDEVGLEYITLHFSHLYTIIAIYVERSLENRKFSGVSAERLHRDNNDTRFLLNITMLLLRIMERLVILRRISSRLCLTRKIKNITR